MTLHIYDELEQGSEQWLAQRRGMVTASVVGKLITTAAPVAIEFACPNCYAPIGESCRHRNTAMPIKTIHSERTHEARRAAESQPPRLVPSDGDEARGLTALLVSERITGWSDPSYFNADMQRGNDIEPIARDWYAEYFGSKYGAVTETGFMVRTFTTDTEEPWDYQIGYSPDGLVGDRGLLEVKAPRAKTHLLTHLAGEVPVYHMPQLQAGLLVSGREWVDFVSYYAGLSPFVKRVHRDERWADAIREAAEHFELTAEEMQTNFAAATSDIPTTERLLTDMEMVL